MAYGADGLPGPYEHVVVTGAAGGIGGAIADEFAARGGVRDGVRDGVRGVALTLVDADPDGLRAAADRLAGAHLGGGTGEGTGGGTGEGTGGGTGGDLEVTVHTVDLTDPLGPETAVRHAWDAHGPVDVLVNAAGVYPSLDMMEIRADDWDRILALNTRAPVLATAELARRAVAYGRAACVVNISSGAALRSRPGGGPYASSKAALEMATRAAALELGPYGIRVNAVSPGFVPVDSAVNPVAPEYAAAISHNPLGRPGTPADVARAVRWIAGPDAAWITGEVLRVDGGSGAGTTQLPRIWPPSAPEHADAPGQDTTEGHRRT
jgi:3-oxoacyl-[acyl-carrier protein] reductase